MFSLNNFKDEKFRDTIKKNYYRLRQKSSSQLSEYLTGQPQHQNVNKNQKEEKTKGLSTKIEEKNIFNNKYKIPNQSKIYIKRPIKEENQIIMKKKKIEEEKDYNNIPLKKRILMKLKEERNEKMKKNNEEKNLANNNYYSKDNSSNNIILTHKRNIGSMDIQNVIYSRNKTNAIHKTKEFSNTINNDGNNNLRNIKFNIEKNIIHINRNNKNLSSQGNKTIFDLNNKDSKFNNSNTKEIYFSNNKTGLIKDKVELANFSKSFLTNQFNRFDFSNDELSENLIINRRKNKIINNKNNEICFNDKRESFFEGRIKFIKEKNEEEKNKNMNDEKTTKNIILNKTFGKHIKYISFFSDTFSSNKLSSINIQKKSNDYTSLKLSDSKSRRHSTEKKEFNIKIKNDSENQKNTNDNLNKKRIIYLPTEKPHLFSKSTLFKNLMIKTDFNNINKYNKIIIDKSINKIRNNSELNEAKEDLKSNNNHLTKKINIGHSNNNYKSPSSLSSRNNKIFFSELLKKDTYYQKTRETSTIVKDSYTIDYIIKMIIEAIQLKNAIEIYSLFNILLINFNNKFIVLFDPTKITKESQPYLNCYKYLSIFIIPLIFFYKDEKIYKINCSEVKKIFENLIYICIEKFGQKAYKYKKILSFLEEYKKAGKNYELFKTMEECCYELVKIVFKNYKEYIPLRKVTEQLLDLSFKESLEKIIYIINNTILYCFNHKQKNNYYLLGQLNHTYKANKSSKNDLTNTNNINNAPSIPYIKTTMKKNFCLVLDIDETIVHTMNLPFDNYFLVRPGVVNFLEEISSLYEIIIFTSSPKSYADSILNKIDVDNKFFSYRLYKEHVIFEKGKSVKKLNLIGRDLNKIIFVDNMKCNAKYNLKNLYLISSWIQDINDQELIKLKMKLKYIASNSRFKDDITKGLEFVI